MEVHDRTVYRRSPFLIGFVVALGLGCDVLGIIAAPVLFIPSRYSSLG